jgi:hypothetical protein
MSIVRQVPDHEGFRSLVIRDDRSPFVTFGILGKLGGVQASIHTSREEAAELGRVLVDLFGDS